MSYMCGMLPACIEQLANVRSYVIKTSEILSLTVG